MEALVTVTLLIAGIIMLSVGLARDQDRADRMDRHFDDVDCAASYCVAWGGHVVCHLAYDGHEDDRAVAAGDDVERYAATIQPCKFNGRVLYSAHEYHTRKNNKSGLVITGSILTAIWGFFGLVMIIYNICNVAVAPV